MFCRIAFVLFLVGTCGQITYAQENIKELPSGYLMTVAAYLSSGEGYAVRYTNKLKKEGYSAEYGFTYKKRMYFVYIHRYDSFRTAVNQINKTRTTTPFDDAWVYVYTAVNPEPTSIEEIPAPSEDLSPIEPQPIKSNTLDTSTVAIETPIPPIPPKDSVVVPVVETHPEGSRVIYLEAVRARTNEPVDINFTIIDPTREKVIGEQEGNTARWTAPPGNASHDISYSSNTFGWRKYSLNINFDHPVTDSTKSFTAMRNDTLIIRFEMSRYKRGDIETLYNVYFFNDASIMRPQSKFELKELLGMLQDNPNYTIMIHGHTNGNASGKIIKLARNDTAYFNVQSDVHIESVSSAKELSIQRALTIKRYLESQGIAASRMKIKGWGGKKMLFDENSSLASKNARVEIEIITD